MRQFKINDIVKVKTVKELEKDFPKYGDGFDCGDVYFIDEMNYLCGKKITVTEDNFDGTFIEIQDKKEVWTLTPDMVHFLNDYKVDFPVEFPESYLAKGLPKSYFKPQLKIKKLRDDAIVPSYGTELSSGFDVRGYECVIWNNTMQSLDTLEAINTPYGKGWMIPSNKTVILKTGFAMACGELQEIQCRARSGYSLKSPMRLSNGIGTIDEDFRGEIGVIMDNNGQYGEWFIPYGERIAQLVVCPIYRPNLIEVDDLDVTIRGEGGYGSTGSK